MLMISRRQCLYIDYIDGVYTIGLHTTQEIFIFLI